MASLPTGSRSAFRPLVARMPPSGPNGLTLLAIPTHPLWAVGEHFSSPSSPCRPSQADPPALASGPSPRLPDQVRQANRTRYDRRQMERAYVAWVRRSSLLLGRRPASQRGAEEVGRFLISLAIGRPVRAISQIQASSALLSLRREVLGRKLRSIHGTVHAKPWKWLPVVLTRSVVRAIGYRLPGTRRLMATLPDGAGPHLRECVRLGVHDIELARRKIVAWEGNETKDRLIPLPVAQAPLAAPVEQVRGQQERDLRAGQGRVVLPPPLAARIGPPAGREEAVGRTRVPEPTGCHTLRHFFGTRLLEDQHDNRTVPVLLGHGDVSTAMIDTHVLNRGGRGIFSPADRR